MRRPAIKIGDNVPLDKAYLVGCGVMTGVGAAIKHREGRTRQQRGGDRFWSCGARVIQGGALAGAGMIIAVDLMDNKLEYAKQLARLIRSPRGRQEREAWAT